jgi:hypothetical protein
MVFKYKTLKNRTNGELAEEKEKSFVSDLFAGEYCSEFEEIYLKTSARKKGGVVVIVFSHSINKYNIESIDILCVNYGYKLDLSFEGRRFVVKINECKIRAYQNKELQEGNIETEDNFEVPLN